MSSDQTPAGASLWALFVRCVTEKYASFTGRATRREYWSFVLFSVLIQFGLGVAAAVLDRATGNNGPESVPVFFFIVVAIAILGLALPSIGVVVRRLHDVGQTGWIYLGIAVMSGVPILNILSFIAMIVLSVYPSQDRANKYGDVAPAY
jgi:uncharacterized membrane protein YhaH (DUF805 family)